jgi:hypothetical protein
VHSFLKLHLDDDHCFLCGRILDEHNRTDEHVIPKWLQSKFTLWSKKLTLLNGSTIPYRQLLIPCCSSCNNESLAQLEAEISNLLLQPFRRLSIGEEHKLFQWCSKLLYGLLHREMSLQLNRGVRSQGKIVRRQFLEDLTTFHHFMTSIICPMRFEGFVPYSLFVAETLVFSNAEKNFDYFDFIELGPADDPILALCLVIRVEQFGIICIFQDNGYQRRFCQGQLDRFTGIPLHPIQFLELACTAACRQSLLSFSPRYHSIASTDPRDEIVVLPANFPDGHIWNDWSEQRYAFLFCSLARQSGFHVPPPEKLYQNGKRYSWLWDADGNPMKIPEEEEPFWFSEDEL